MTVRRPEADIKHGSPSTASTDISLPVTQALMVTKEEVQYILFVQCVGASYFPCLALVVVSILCSTKFPVLYTYHHFY